MKRTDEYAGNQIRLLLGDLKNSTHPNKVKAIQRFQMYIESTKPNISDDNVDFLFTGNLDGKSTLGLLYFCGQESDKHDGQLKRIAQPSLDFLHWLVTFQGDEIYYQRFVMLPKEDLVKINFPKHIIILNDSSNKITNFMKLKGNNDNIFDLLSILLHDHRNAEDELEAVDISYLLGNSKMCQDRFEDWLQNANLEHINETLELLKAGGQGSNLQRTKEYPTQWSDVNFKCVPLQEGEFVGAAEIDEGSKEPPPIPDPLGLYPSVDLRIYQEHITRGEAQVSQANATGRRNSNAFAPPRASIIAGKMPQMEDDEDDDADDADDDDDDDEDDHNKGIKQVNRARVLTKKSSKSVVPSDKNFSVHMFLQYVHNKTNFEELQQGLEHLKEHVQQQSSRRENLVRTHFGLFVQCADGLEWLKGYQEGKNLAANTNRRNSAPINPFDLKATLAAGTTTTAIGFEKGMSQLKNASAILDEAKIEAKKSLDPILSGIQKSREIRSAEKVLRGMSALLDYPHSMKLAFDRHDYQEVVHLYYRVLAIPNTTSLKIVAKVKSSAEMVIQDLKKSCLATLMSPQTNYGIIYKHARILLDLEGPQYYQQILRHCFLRNLLHVLLLLKDSKLRFIQDSLDAYEKGQELNRGPSGAAVTLKTMSNWTNSASNNSIVNESMRSSDEIQQNAILLMRKYASASTMSSYSAASTSSTRRRTSSGNSISVRPTLVVTGHTPNGISRKAFGNNGNSSKRQSTKRSVRRGSIGSNSSSAGNGMDEEYVLDEFDDPADHVQADLLYSEDEQMMIDDATTGKQQPWMRLLLSGAQFISDQPEDEEDDDGDHFQQDSIDYAEILCHVVRKTYGDNVMDVVGKHFHCLFQICVELLTQSINTANASTTGATTNGAVPVRGLVSQASTRLGGAPPTPFTSQASIRAGPGGFLSPPPSALPSKTANPATVPATVPTRSIGMSCSRLLGAILNNTSENLQQVVHGISKNLYANSKFASNVLGIPTEVLSTFSELDQFLNSVQSQFTNWSIKVDFSDFLTANSSNNIANPDANNTAIMMSVSRFMDLLKAASSGTANAMIVATVTNAFQKPLRNPLFDEALSDLYNLYDGLESIFKSSQANFNQQLDGAKGNSGAGGGTTIGGVPNYLSSPQYGNRSNILASPNRDSLELDYNSSSSPYYEAMYILQLLAREGEQAIAQKVLDRILDRSFFLCDWFLSNGNTDLTAFRKLDMATRNSVTGGIGSLKLTSDYDDEDNDNPASLANKTPGVENAVIEFESLIIRGIYALKMRLKRHDWSSGLVYESVFQKIFSSFLERLRRKMLFVEDTKLSTALPKMEMYGGSHSPSDLRRTQQHRKKSMSSRASMHQSHLILQSLEEELRYCESGWERDFSHLHTSDGNGSRTPHSEQLKRFQEATSSLQAKTKHMEWIDCIRGFIRLRTHSVPLLLRCAGKVFSLDYNPTASATTSTTGFLGGNNSNANSAGVAVNLFGSALPPPPPINQGNTAGGSSLLNRLFAVEAIEEAPAAPTNASASLSPTLQPFSGMGNAMDAQKSGIDRILLIDKIMNTTIYNPIGGMGGAGGSNKTTATSSALSGNLYHTNTAAGSVLLPYLKDCISMEVGSTEKYISYRLKTLQSILFAAYAYIVHYELSGERESCFGYNPQTYFNIENNTLPVHISRVVLALHDEKLLLCSAIRNISIEHGGGKDEYSQQTTPGAVALQAMLLDSDNEEDDDRASQVGEGEVEEEKESNQVHNILSNDANKAFEAINKSTNSTSLYANTSMVLTGQSPRYRHYLYMELCKGIIVLYEELMQKLHTNSFVSNFGSRIPYQALAQAWEEWEFFKAVLRPILPSLDEEHQNQKLSGMYLSTTDLAAINSTLQMHKKNSSLQALTSREELLEASKLLAVMIQ